MFCKNCGKEVADGTKFCPNCGAQIGAAAQTAEPKTAEPKTETYTGTVNGVTGGPTKRNIGVCIRLSIVPCGIYGIIWLVQMVDELHPLVLVLQGGRAGQPRKRRTRRHAGSESRHSVSDPQHHRAEHHLDGVDPG